MGVELRQATPCDVGDHGSHVHAASLDSTQGGRDSRPDDVPGGAGWRSGQLSVFRRGAARTWMRSPSRPSMLRISTGSVTGGAEPVRHPCVELGDLAGPHRDVVLGEDQSQLSRPARTATRSPRGCAARARLRSGGMTTFQACSPPGCRVSGTTIRPLALLAARSDPRVADLGRPDQLVERDPVGLGDRQQQLEARLALPGLQTATACSSRSPSPRPARSSVDVPLRPHPPQPGADLGQHSRDRGRVATTLSATTRFPETATEVVTQRRGA